MDGGGYSLCMFPLFNKEIVKFHVPDVNVKRQIRNRGITDGTISILTSNGQRNGEEDAKGSCQHSKRVPRLKSTF